MMLKNGKLPFRIAGWCGVVFAAAVALCLCTSCASEEEVKKEEAKPETEKPEDRFAFLRREEKEHPESRRAWTTDDPADRTGHPDPV